jgi:hypothetical protein
MVALLATILDRKQFNPSFPLANLAQISLTYRGIKRSQQEERPAATGGMTTFNGRTDRSNGRSDPT